MFTFTFQLFLVVCTLGVVVAAIHTHRADRREAVRKADNAFYTANQFVNARVRIGYYDHRGARQMKKDFDDMYIKLISSK